ncbi:J domain-containing protein [Niabella hibiscisoli]|uniref:J domain-containing protein n=1 Tax=Niabella hibiscisoli TaxID=1825928 RepID=UPI001F0EE0A8|nr:DnaJ domain-containing protein [Niabella hibiscisoli]MCH5717406.1 DnaJ domain-containing protein [Niabella hibiscisoli]
MAIDYYQILQIPQSADLAEIKSAYRRLAHQYHPDKNPENQSALAYFELIKEAYETLSNPGKKDQYLQERWLSKANGQLFEQPVRTPEDLLKLVLSASDKIHRMDIYRMNKIGIKEELDLLLTEERVNLLNDFNEPGINDAIVKELLQLTMAIPTTAQSDYLKKLQTIQSNYIEILQQKEEELAGKVFGKPGSPHLLFY